MFESNLTFPTGDLKHRSIHGGAVTMLAQAGKFFLQLAATIVLARLVTPEDYGLFSIVISIAIFVGLFRDLGLSTATIQRAEISPHELSALFWVNTTWGLVLAVITVLLAPPIAAFFHEPRLVEMLWAMAALPLFGGIGSQPGALLNRAMRFKLVAGIDLMAIALGTVVGIAAAWRGWGYWSLVAIQVVIAGVRSVGGLIAARWMPLLPRATSLRAFMLFGGHITGVNALTYLTRNLDNMLIGWLRGARELGFYDKAYQLMLIPILQINIPIAALAIAVLSRLVNSPARYRDYFSRIVLICATLGMPLIAFLFVATEPVVRFLLGEAWMESVPLFRALAPAAFVDTFASAISWMLVSLGQTARQLRSSIVITLVLVAGLTIGVQWGALGVGIAFSLCRVGSILPLILYACQQAPVRWTMFLQAVARPALASLGAALLLAFASGWILATANLWLTVVLMSVFYAIAYPALWVLIPGGRKMLNEIWRLAGTLREDPDV